VKRRALFISIAFFCALALATFWNFKGNGHRPSHSVSSTTGTGSFSTTRPMPSFRIPTSSKLESSDNKEAPTPLGTPPLTLASNTITERRPAAPDPQLLVVKQMLRDYRAALGENPVGTNAEITKALLGANSRNSNFISEEARVSNGRLVDHWNHPYFFHQLSRSQMQIRSAGPDGKMWTADDELSP
jgi:hypothetical protein